MAYSLIALSSAGLPNDLISTLPVPLNLKELIESSDGPDEFWSRLAELLSGSWGFSQLLVIQKSGDGVRLLGKSTSGRIESVPSVVRQAVVSAKGEEGRQVEGKSWSIVPVEGPAGSVFHLVGELQEGIADGGEQLKLMAEAAIAAFHARLRAERQAESHEQLSKVLDIGLLVGEAPHFDEAAIRLCNEVAHQLGAMRVSLGWKRNERIRLVATNHGGRIRNDTEMAGSLSRAMEEVLLHDTEVGCPALSEDVISQQHKSYSESQGNSHLLSMPLRSNSGVTGALTIEHPNEDEPVGQEQVDALRVVLDLIGPHMNELYRRTGWIVFRMWRNVRRFAGGLLGYRHTGWKLAGTMLVLLFMVSCLVRATHKVKAPFILKAQSSAILTAPFAGYIERVHKQVGEHVKQGELLVELDKRELLLQRAELISQRDRERSDARRYEAEGKLADMRLAQLGAEQAESKLRIVDYRLSRTEIRAPFDAVIVEGDLIERLASPTQAGEMLLRVVQVSGAYADLQVDERDVHFLEAGMKGKLAFTSRPDERFSVRMDTFEPVAVVEESGTDFRMRVAVTGESQDWWRPGMTGTCKIKAGHRSLAWIWLHRSWEFIRMKLWF